jgi:hypothetical protein
MHTASVRVAVAVGAVYVLVGAAGFAVTGGHDATGHGAQLFGVQVNPLHNLAHLALGALLVAGACRGAAAARQVMLVVGLVFLLLGLVGPLITGTAADLIALNSADDVLHAATSLVLVGSAVVIGRRRLQPAG